MADADRAEAAEAASADDLVAEADTGARNPSGWVGKSITWTCIIWSLFQIYIASAIPFWLTRITGLPLVLNSDQTRPIHLAFAIALATMAFPLFKSSPRRSIPWYDWGLLVLGIGACLYLVVFKAAIAERPGLPITADLVASTIGIAVLMIAVFRSLGLPLLCVAGAFLLYAFFGHSDWLPEVMRWKGASYSKAMWHFWMQTEGVFGVALGVSTSMIFLFVLFGALLEKSGGGNWFIKVAISLLGGLRGGPAKAAVLSSASTGMISGSSIANTVTTGTFTIPLMKRVGFPAEKAGAVEVASSTNGQLTPPVMGAAAFLMIEYVGVSYIEVIKHAFLPAVISYIALLYIVHLEALKLGLQGLEKEGRKLGFLLIMLLILTGIGAAAIVAVVMHYLLGFIYASFPDEAFLVSALLLIAIYVGLIVVASRQPDLVVDDPNSPLMVAPRFTPTILAGLYYLVPIGVLVWCLMYMRLSPGLSAFWATACMLFIAVTHSTLKALVRGAAAKLGETIGLDWHNMVEGLISGARNMIGIGVATGAAGIIVGTISLTGAHQMIGLMIEYIAGDNLMVLLILVAILSLILGMGLPTTANYIVVSSLMAPVIVTVGA
ncbi:MAG: TRAP transporter permease, partial [Hyphomicrobiales bacterium]|nr:TRAP transporter permease [Hyphomicrobiales bacterium]